MSAFIGAGDKPLQWQYNDTYQAQNVTGYEEGPIKVSNDIGYQEGPVKVSKKSTSSDDSRDGFKKQTREKEEHLPDKTPVLIPTLAESDDKMDTIYNENAMITISNDIHAATTADQKEDLLPAVVGHQDTIENGRESMPSTSGLERNFSVTSSGSRGEWDFIDSMENGHLIKKMIRSHDYQIQFMRAELHTKNELIDSLLKIINVLMTEQKNRRDTVYAPKKGPSSS